MAPLLVALVFCLCVSGAILSVSTRRAMPDFGATIDRLLAETIEDWLDIDTFSLPGLRAADHPLGGWLMAAMRPEHPVLIWPHAGARGSSRVEAGDTAANHGTGPDIAAGSRDTAIW